MRLAKWYREYAEKLEGKVSAEKRVTWGDIWEAQETAIKKAMLDMRMECAKVVRDTNESLADEIMKIQVK